MRPGHVIVLVVMVSAFRTSASSAEPVRCSDVNRLGKSLQHVEPPISCLSSPGDGAATWCDTPGTNYPWQEIREYLRRSSEQVTRRTGQLDPGDIQRLLNKYGIADTRIASAQRQRRAADVTGARDVTGQQLVREAGRVTSRGSSWEAGTATSATEPTNFELQEETLDGSSDTGSAKTVSKRINDKNLSEEDELVILLTYFTNPNNAVFTESVLEGLLRLRGPFGNDGEQTTETDSVSSQDSSFGGKPNPPISPPADETQEESSVNASKPVGVSAEAAENPSTVQNGTLLERQQLANTTANVAKNPGEVAHRPVHIPPQTPPKPSSPPTASPARPPTTSSAPTGTASTSFPSSSFAAPSLFPDTLSRRPSPSSPGGSIPAETRPGEDYLPGTRTGVDVLTEIRTGDDILADITAADEMTVYHEDESQHQHDWSWDDAQDSWDQDDQDSWTGEEQSAWTGEDSWSDANQDSWGDESIPPEVQYYRPSTPSAGRPDAVDAFEWHNSPAPEWRPLPSPLPPQAGSLVARPPERAPQGSGKIPLRGAEHPEEGERVVLNYGERLSTTRRPTTAGSTLMDLSLIEETVYTNAIYRPQKEAEVTQTAAMTASTTTAEPMTSPMTTPDPYVMSACETTVEVRSPFYAKNTQNVWKLLINIPPFETYIHMESCVAEHERGRCAAGCRCTQRRTIRSMPVYVRDSHGCDRIYMDKFPFRSHCDCMCLPLHHVLFNLTRPAPTTPATSIAGLGNSTLLPGPTDGNSGGGSSSSRGGGGEAAPHSGQTDNSTSPSHLTDGASAEALKAAGLAARVVTAAPTPSPVSRQAAGAPPRAPPPRRPVVPADSLVRSHRNRNRGPAFPSTLHRHSSTNSVTRRNGRVNDILRLDGRVSALPRPLPRR